VKTEQLRHAGSELGLMLAFTVVWGLVQPTVERLMEYSGEWAKRLGLLALPFLLASRMLHNYAHAGTHKLLHRALHAAVARFCTRRKGGKLA
jgi:hypothetical protein